MLAGERLSSWGAVGTRGGRPHCITCHTGSCEHAQQLVDACLVEDPGSKHKIAPELAESRCAGAAGTQCVDGACK